MSHPGTAYAQYMYSSAPQKVATLNPVAYRHDRCFDRSGQGLLNQPNIMWDKRVIRGNTFAIHVDGKEEPSRKEVLEHQRRQRRQRRARQQQRLRHLDFDSIAVENREHVAVQTELYIEELSYRVEEADCGVQTDPFLDRPPSPYFVPCKTGTDACTQIYDGDLFDYDVEVRPILDVLVGKTIEQALLEVMEEEELASIRAQQRAFSELRDAEVAEQQRLAEQHRRLLQEKRERVSQRAAYRKLENETMQKIQSRAFAVSYLADLVPTVFGQLQDGGYFFDPVERDLEQSFMPSLMDSVVSELRLRDVGRRLLDDLIVNVVMERQQRQYVCNRKESLSREDNSLDTSLTMSDFALDMGELSEQKLSSPASERVFQPVITRSSASLLAVVKEESENDPTEQPPADDHHLQLPAEED